MDYALAIRRNPDQLKDIVLALFALAGGLTSPRRGEVSPKATERGFPLFLPRSTVAMIMMVLRPAESAVRRLIVIAALGLKLNSLAKSAAVLNSPHSWGEVPGFAGRRGVYRAFPLFDPLKSFDPESIWDHEPTYKSGYNLAKSVTCHDASNDHTPMDARPLALRLNALIRAINNIPAQARRLKRWEAKRDALLKASKPTRLSPMRPGPPPGWRQRKLHEIDDVLRECHGLANDRLSAPNTS